MVLKKLFRRMLGALLLSAVVAGTSLVQADEPAKLPQTVVQGQTIVQGHVAAHAETHGTLPLECQGDTWRGDVFYNYYVGPGPCGMYGASLYPSPLPVPYNVPGTYITYQPLLPHEMLYKHKRTYQRTYAEGVNTTKVRWR